ncbi:hypothetical protein [Photobacterium kagoshimensis]|uniref:hypothetical protein n=1 Tax=Photobacterium kagoshimensis TaxID=2910242 RepID=UPI003D0A69B3
MASELSVVIHAEEEFDWKGGFDRSNTRVSPQHILINLVDALVAQGAKVTLAMDYAFVNSVEGKKVIEHFKWLEGSYIEFACHLHPWVNPPFYSQTSSVSNFASYPGNLAPHEEKQKIIYLTEKIAEVCGVRPVSYLAGRHGVGVNTLAHIVSLGYEIDLSICPYYDFSVNDGPNFSQRNCSNFTEKGMTFLPHTAAVTSWLPFIESVFNRQPKTFSQWQNNKLLKFMGQLIGLRLDRLSPEGLSLRQMKRVFKAQQKIGQNNFILSFHSSSFIPYVTPYTQGDDDVAHLVERVLSFVRWAIENQHCEMTLPKHHATPRGERMNEEVVNKKLAPESAPVIPTPSHRSSIKCESLTAKDEY